MEKEIKILVVDDEEIVLNSIKKHLKYNQDYLVSAVLNVDDALKHLSDNEASIVLTDLMMPDIDGLEFLKILQTKYPDILPIMITGYATINTALQATQLGAFDYIAKPFTREELRNVVKRASDLSSVTDQSKKPESAKDKVSVPKGFEGIKGIGEHTWMMKEKSGNVLLGVERPFLYSIGKIQTVYLPSVGDELRQGSVYFQAFSSDLRSQSLLTPVSGFVVEVNQKVIDDPNVALQEPYSEGWLLRILPSNFEDEVKILGF